MQKISAKKTLLVSLLVSGIVITAGSVRQGSLPKPRQYIGLGSAFFIAAVLVEAAPTFGASLALLVTAAVVLRHGQNAAEAVLDSQKKGRVFATSQASVIPELAPEISGFPFPQGRVPSSTGVGPCAKVIGNPGQGTHSSGGWENTNAVDLQAPRGTPILAPFDGVIGTSFGSSAIGGNRLHILGRGANPHDSYFAHLSAFAPGIRPGARVRRGQVIGYVGDTGSAKGTSPHLHYAMPPPWRTAAFNSRVLQCK